MTAVDDAALKRTLETALQNKLLDKAIKVEDVDFMPLGSSTQMLVTASYFPLRGMTGRRGTVSLATQVAVEGDTVLPDEVTAATDRITRQAVEYATMGVE